jgi:hypothetical protein
MPSNNRAQPMRAATRRRFARCVRSVAPLVGVAALAGAIALVSGLSPATAAESGSPLGGSLLSAPAATPSAPAAQSAPAKGGSPLGGSLLGAPAPQPAAPGSGGLLIYSPGASPPPSAPAAAAGAPADLSHYRELANKLYQATSSDAATFEKALADPALRQRLAQALKTPLTDDKLRAMAAHAQAEADYWNRYREGLAQQAEKMAEGKKAKSEQPGGKSLPPWSIGTAPPPAAGLPPPPGPPEPSAGARPQGAPSGGVLSSIFPLGQTTAPPEVRTVPWPLLGVGKLPERPAPLLELGNGFLDTGPLTQGFTLPGGAVWQPRLWVFGTYRTALQSFDPGTKPRTTEWANRLDLFANLQLTGTERLLIGLRPFDRDVSGGFAGWQIEPTGTSGGKEFFNADISTLFFEGDLGSTFPDLDTKGILPIDFGYSVGRQPLFYQNGMLMNDTVDAVGITRNSIHVPFSSNMQLGFFYADKHIRRPNRPLGVGPEPSLWGITSSTDILESTYDVDLLRENDQIYGDTWFVGAAAIQHYGLLNTALRVNASLPDGKQNLVSTKGVLFSLETSFTPFRSDDIVYFNPYVALGNFTQASKDPIVAGPLGALGITYAAYGIGTAVSPLSSAAQDVAGFALGYEAFWDNHRRSLTLELGVREQTRVHTFNAQAIGARFQQALGQRVVLEVDTTYTRQENHDNAYGLRTELLYQF